MRMSRDEADEPPSGHSNHIRMFDEAPPRIPASVASPPCRPWVRSRRCSTSGTRPSTPTSGTPSGSSAATRRPTYDGSCWPSTRWGPSSTRRSWATRTCSITHHPLFLKGVHGFAATTPKGRVVHRLMGNGCALFTAHTNADSPAGGVSESLALALGLVDVRPLEPDPRPALDKLVVFTPTDAADQVRAAIADAGAGRIGDYDQASFSITRARAGSARWTARTRRSGRWVASRPPTRSASRACCRPAAVTRSSPRCWRSTPTRSRRTTSSSSCGSTRTTGAPAGSAGCPSR